MHWRLMITVVLGLSLTTFACDDDEEPGNGLSFSGSNGCTIDGDGLDMVSVNCTDNSGKTTRDVGGSRTYHFTSVSLEGEYEGEPVFISIVYTSDSDALTSGEKRTGLTVSESLKIFVRINGRHYESELSFFNGPAIVNFTKVGDRLQGSFRGTLQERDAKVEIFGRFDVENQRD